MAKKVVATLKQPGGAKFAKVIRAVKTENGNYAYREEMVPEGEVKNVLAKKN
ncbi:DUF4295 family protein [Marinoscillum furvescens]|uniref:Uncharacterized protein DUF4295 n=1 Tax=Marinoscillum furvescens DSM 4134 TaxID=1122208 RepID=A0A3D9L8F2_MARFU|nr:DUF4295 family protein [Marinoscillum furvescens]REE01765.1 uncharacterized protein DUF4295 [Marinoscillum furvescens DSM 4134]